MKDSGPSSRSGGHFAAHREFLQSCGFPPLRVSLLHLRWQFLTTESIALPPTEEVGPVHLHREHFRDGTLEESITSVQGREDHETYSI